MVCFRIEWVFQRKTSQKRGGIQYHKKIPIAQGLEIGNGLKFDRGEIQ